MTPSAARAVTDSATAEARHAPSGAPALPAAPTTRQIFMAFLLLGATSFGGGVVGYLRQSLVARHRWLDDKTFVEMLGISQTIPGLNAVNMAILAGDRLRGTVGAVAAAAGMCLPGAVIMYVAGIGYRLNGARRSNEPHAIETVFDWE